MKRVLIVEDVIEAQRWLSEVVATAFPQARIRTADRVRGAMGMLAQPFDLALIDLGLPDGSGLEVLRRLKEVQPGTQRVVTTTMGDDASIVAALAAGADGYLLKDAPTEVVARQLSDLAYGMPALSPAVARRIMDHFRQTGPAAATDDHLTPRETEVLSLIARGLRNTEVAAHLGIADTTVAGYIKAIYAKLGISSRAEATWHAFRLGLNSDKADGRPQDAVRLAVRHGPGSDKDRDA